MLIQQAIGATGRFTCPCGERFFAGQCGRPRHDGITKAVKCPNCGNNIFERAYELAGGAREDNGPGGSPKGFSDIDSDSVRGLPLRTTQTLKFIVASLMLAALGNGAAGAEQAVPSARPAELLLNMLTRLFNRLTAALGVGPDETALALHMVGLRLATHGGDVFRPCVSEEERAHVERDLAAIIDQAFPADLSTLRVTMAELRRAGPLAAVQPDVDEVRPLDGSAEAIAFRKSHLPCLFVVRETPSLRHLKDVLDEQGGSRVAPTLSLLMARHLSGLTPALRHYPRFLDMLRLLFGRFNRAITSEVARQKPLAEVVRDGAARGWGTEKMWRDAHEGFRELWNGLYRREIRDECKELKIPALSEEAKLAVCLPSAVDEGRYVAAIMKAMLTHQNQVLDEIVAARGGEPAPAAPAAAAADRDADEVKGGDAAPERKGHEDEHAHEADGAQPAAAEDAEARFNALPLHLRADEVIRLDPAELEAQAALAYTHDCQYGVPTRGAYDFAQLERYCATFVLGRARPVTVVSWPQFSFKEDCDLGVDAARLEGRVGGGRALDTEQAERVRRHIKSVDDVNEAEALLGPLVAALAHTVGADVDGGETVESVVGSGIVPREDAVKRTPFLLNDEKAAADAAPVTIAQLPALCKLLRQLRVRMGGLEFLPIHSTALDAAACDALRASLAEMDRAFRQAIIAAFRDVVAGALAGFRALSQTGTKLLDLLQAALDQLDVDVSEANRRRLERAFERVTVVHALSTWRVLSEFDAGNNRA